MVSYGPRGEVYGAAAGDEVCTGHGGPFHGLEFDLYLTVCTELTNHLRKTEETERDEGRDGRRRGRRGRQGRRKEKEVKEEKEEKEEKKEKGVMEKGVTGE